MQIFLVQALVNGLMKEQIIKATDPQTAVESFKTIFEEEEIKEPIYCFVLTYIYKTCINENTINDLLK